MKTQKEYEILRGHYDKLRQRNREDVIKNDEREKSAKKARFDLMVENAELARQLDEMNENLRELLKVSQ